MMQLAQQIIPKSPFMILNIVWQHIATKNNI